MKRKRLTYEEAQARARRCRELWREGWTHAAIADALGCSRDTVTYYLGRRRKVCA